MRLQADRFPSLTKFGDGNHRPSAGRRESEGEGSALPAEKAANEQVVAASRAGHTPVATRSRSSQATH